MLIRIVAILSLMVTSVFAGAEASQAPDFTLPSYSGGNVRLREYHGDVVLVNFWASWCGPCRKEMPQLDALHKRYSKAGLTIIGINVEKNQVDALRAVAEFDVGFSMLFDQSQGVADTYAVKAMPSSMLIDRDGRVRYVHLGYRAGDEQIYQQKIVALLKE